MRNVCKSVSDYALHRNVEPSAASPPLWVSATSPFVLKVPVFRQNISRATPCQLKNKIALLGLFFLACVRLPFDVLLSRRNVAVTWHVIIGLLTDMD